MTKQQYIEYLICTPGGNYTCTNLANHLEGQPGTSHDAIRDCLRREKLTPRQSVKTAPSGKWCSHCSTMVPTAA